MINFVCFKAVHDFMWHILPPFCPYVRPPHSELVSEGDRYICHILVLPFLGGRGVDPCYQFSVWLVQVKRKVSYSYIILKV